MMAFIIDQALLWPVLIPLLGAALCASLWTRPDLQRVVSFSALVLMAAARTIYGVFGSAAPIASQAYVADRTTGPERTQAMSLLASAQGLG
ncbi:MAG: hypothetical protein EOO27_11160, partial [Comamonadaceae bacterium]